MIRVFIFILLLFSSTAVFAQPEMNIKTGLPNGSEILKNKKPMLQENINILDYIMCYSTEGDVSTYYYTYDLKGIKLSWLKQNFIDGQWINDKQGIFTYDDANNNFCELKKSWDGELWQDNARYTYFYNSIGNITSVREDIIDDGIWINCSKGTFIYDSVDNPQLYYAEKWKNGIWKKNGQCKYHYNINGNLDTLYIEASLDGQNWITAGCYIYNYDINENLLTRVRETNYSGEWSIDYKETYSYDINNNLITNVGEKLIGEEWNYSDGNLSFGEMNDYVYSFDNCYKIKITWKTITSVEDKTSNFISLNNFPNPFSNSTTIKYELPEPAFIELSIYNYLGIEVDKIVNNEQLSAGSHEVVYQGAKLPAGAYFYRLKAGDKFYTGKFVKD